MTPELWTVRGNRPRLWTIPVWIEQNGKQAKVFPAIPLLATQLRALHWRLEDQGAKREGDEWVIPAGKLKLIAMAAPKIDPEYLLTWEHLRLADLPKRKRAISQDQHDFVDDMYLRGIGQSREVLRYWFVEFANQMLDWLVNHERPVDLGFCILHPSPYRLGWQHRIYEGVKNYGKKRGPRHKRAVGQIEKRYLIVDKGRHCRRTIEIEFPRTWWKIIDKVESERLELLGDYGYATNFMASVRRREAVSYRLYNQWMADRLGSASSVILRATKGIKEYHKYIRHLRIFKRRAAHGAGDPVAVARKLRRLEYLAIKELRLQKMLAFQQANKDVRDGRAYLPIARDGQAGGAGVLVPLPDGQRDGEKLLADGKEQRHDGLAKATE